MVELLHWPAHFRANTTTGLAPHPLRATKTPKQGEHLKPTGLQRVHRLHAHHPLRVYRSCDQTCQSLATYIILDTCGSAYTQLSPSGHFKVAPDLNL